MSQIIPTQMKQLLDDGSMTDDSPVDSVTVDPVVRGFIRDWDAVEDLLHHVLYAGLGWEIGNEGQILFTDPLCTPKVCEAHHVFSFPFTHIYQLLNYFIRKVGPWMRHVSPLRFFYFLPKLFYLLAFFSVC